VNFLDYFYHAHHHDLADEAGPETAPAYFHWRRSMAAIDLLDLEQAALGWISTQWQRDLFPAEYRDEFLVLHDGIDTRRLTRSHWHATGTGPRSIAGRVISADTKVVSFVARSLDRLRGFDRFFAVANALLAARTDVLCVVVGDRIVKRGLDVAFHNRDYAAHLAARHGITDPGRLWFVGASLPAVVGEVLAASDLHIAPGRPYPVARSLLEAMAAGCVVLASDTDPHREIIAPGQTGVLVDVRNSAHLAEQALKIVADVGSYRPLGDAASVMVGERFAQDVCLPKLAERFTALVAGRRERP
jgi:glycosyltransferase involved in cell wall biosynthesis